MAQNTTKSISANTWVQLTDADITAATFQVRPSSFGVFIAGTTGASAPTTTDGSIYYSPNQGEVNVLMGDLFPGISAVRLWAYSDGVSQVMISHA